MILWSRFPPTISMAFWGQNQITRLVHQVSICRPTFSSLSNSINIHMNYVRGGKIRYIMHIFKFVLKCNKKKTLKEERKKKNSINQVWSLMPLIPLGKER